MTNVNAQTAGLRPLLFSVTNRLAARLQVSLFGLALFYQEKGENLFADEAEQSILNRLAGGLSTIQGWGLAFAIISVAFGITLAIMSVGWSTVKADPMALRFATGRLLLTFGVFIFFVFLWDDFVDILLGAAGDLDRDFSIPSPPTTEG